MLPDGTKKGAGQTQNGLLRAWVRSSTISRDRSGGAAKPDLQGWNQVT